MRRGIKFKVQFLSWFWPKVYLCTPSPRLGFCKQLVLIPDPLHSFFLNTQIVDIFVECAVFCFWNTNTNLYLSDSGTLWPILHISCSTVVYILCPNQLAIYNVSQASALTQMKINHYFEVKMMMNDCSIKNQEKIEMWMMSTCC